MTPAETTDAVRIDITGTLTVVHLDDGRANALSPAVVATLAGAVDESRGAGRALVLCGRPGRLSAGFDLEVMKQGGDTRDALVTAGRDLYLDLFAFERPVVVACTGHAIAAGAGLLVVADWRVGAAGEHRIGFNEVAIGHPISATTIELVRHRLSTAGLEGVVRGELHDPEAAVDVGFLDEVAEPGAVVDRAIATAERLAALEPAAFAAVKARVRRTALDAALAARI